jgi:hypothetical protein
MKVADTLLANYVSSVAGIPAEDWTVQCGQGTETDVKIAYKSDGNRVNSVIVCASASFLVPVPMNTAFVLLKNNLLRAKVCWSLPAATWQQHDLQRTPCLKYLHWFMAVGCPDGGRYHKRGSSCRQWRGK